MHMIYKLVIILSILVQSSFAQVCSQLYISKTAFDKRVETFISQHKYLPPVSIEKIKKLDLRTKTFLLEVTDKYKMDDFIDALKAYKSNPQYFSYKGNFQIRKFLNEVTNSGYARSSFQRKVRLQSVANPNSNWKVPQFKTGAKIKDMDKKYRNAYVEINRVLMDEKLVFKRMQQLEDEVMLRSRMSHPKFSDYSAEKQAVIKQKKLIEILDETEELNGFISDAAQGYKALDLDNRSYTKDEWFEMLQSGKIFNDTAFKQVDNAASITQQMRAGHGFFTHRIQWYVVMQEMMEDSSRFAHIKAVDLYKKLGDQNFNAKLGLANGSNDTLWQQLFDAFDGTYRQPEFFRKQHELFPELGAWL